jgi:hypothetical protein
LDDFTNGTGDEIFNVLVEQACGNSRSTQTSDYRNGSQAEDELCWFSLKRRKGANPWRGKFAQVSSAVRWSREKRNRCESVFSSNLTDTDARQFARELEMIRDERDDYDLPYSSGRAAQI